MSQSDEAIERILRFNCNDGCDGRGSYPEMSPDGEWEQGQCQWCFEFGMPARDAIQASEVEARLDELDAIVEVKKSESLYPYQVLEHIIDRIAELKANKAKGE